MSRAILAGALAALGTFGGSRGASAQSTAAHMRVGIEYRVLERVVNDVQTVFTRTAGRTLDATSRFVFTSKGAWTVVVELVAPVPSGLDAFVVLGRGRRLKLSAASPRGAVASSPTPCDQCPMTIQWQFVAVGAGPPVTAPRVRVVIQAGMTQLSPGQP